MEKAGTLDFDPRSWSARDASLVEEGSSTARRARRWPWLAGSGLCFAGALVAAWIGRDRAAPVVVQPAGAAFLPPATVAQPSAGLIERTATLDEAGQIDTFLAEQGLAPAVVATVAKVARASLAGAGGLTVTASLHPGPAVTLATLRAVHEDSSGVLVTRAHVGDGAGAWHVERIARAVSTHLVGGSAQVTGDSLYASAVAAGLDEALLPDFAKAFAYDVDFQKEVGPGDAFEMEAEQGVNAGGRPVGAPQLVFARLTTQARSLILYRFADAGAAPGWYDANGRSVVRSFMRTPVDGARVSSAFGVRTHPILDVMKMHEGVDFAVPLGTPIYAASDGTVLTAHLSATAGNMVELRHDRGMMTRYFHMTRFADGIAPGVRVHQGQVIGLSGSTGRSTGPHLHYELRLDGKAVDPLTYQTDAGHSLAGAALVAFRRERDRIDAARAHQAS